MTVQVNAVGRPKEMNGVDGVVMVLQMVHVTVLVM